LNIEYWLRCQVSGVSKQRIEVRRQRTDFKSELWETSRLTSVFCHLTPETWNLKPFNGEDMSEFEPKIVAFLCNWCAYAGADLAGVSRLQYPSNLRTIRVMCSGRVDPVFIVNALREGADGVLVAGWHIGDCHYLEGNVYADKKVRLTRNLLDLTGIGRNRLHLAWVSSAEAQRFAQIATEVTESVREQGALDVQAFALELEAAFMTVSAENLRWLVSKELKITAKGDVYGRQWDTDSYETIMDSVLEREYHKNLIYAAIKTGKRSVREISQSTGLALKRVSYLLADLEKTNRVAFEAMEDSKPVFSAL
jgi:F420-non-reducing hydrogenase iron-sulfur subunit